METKFGDIYIFIFRSKLFLQENIFEMPSAKFQSFHLFTIEMENKINVIYLASLTTYNISCLKLLSDAAPETTHYS